MNSRRGLLLLAAPLAGGVLLITALAVRRDPAVPVPARPSLAHAPRAAQTPAIVPAPLPKPAPPEAVARAVDEDRLRSTYQNYRTAVATGNEVLAKALHPVLVKDRDAAVRLAEEEVARASTPSDREVARKTLETLRR
jgi:hypothetical protein